MSKIIPTQDLPMKFSEFKMSDQEKSILNMPFKDLTPEDRSIAFSLSDKIADYNRSQSHISKGRMVIQDKDILLKNGVISPLDGKTAFHNRKDWANHLKANGCVEIGNDFNNSTKKQKEIVGDFDCRNELGKATYQVMEKYGN